MADNLSSYLTKPNPELAALQSKTPHGMAHWAGTGPDGSSCGKCALYGYSYTTGTGKAVNCTTGCARYYRLIREHGGSLPENTPGCKYFEPKAGNP